MESNNNDCSLTCSHHGCEIKFSKEYYTSDDDGSDKCHTIFAKLLSTRLFCMKHCTLHATLICKNSRIQIEE